MNTRTGWKLLSALSLAMATTIGAAGEARADGAHRGVQSALFRSEGKPAEAQRVYMGWGVLSIPPFFQPVNGKYDLIVHFHGGAQLQEENIEKAQLNALVVSVNLGISSGAYSDMYGAPGALDRLLTRTQEELDKTGRFPGARLGRIALAAWSAGFAAVGGLLSQPGMAERVDAVILADGFHAAYLGNHKIHSESLEKYATYGDMAARGQKLFVLTHSSIGVTGYASTTETTNELLRIMQLPKTPHAVTGPRGMHEIYEVNRGGLHIKGFEGTDEKAHIDHIKGMHELAFPYLRARWSHPST